MKFEWDPAKASSNLRKHKVTFETAARVFLDPFHYEIDEQDEQDIMRYKIVGMVDGRLLHVTYTMRGDVRRIISARGAEPHERKRYHEL